MELLQQWWDETYPKAGVRKVEHISDGVLTVQMFIDFANWVKEKFKQQPYSTLYGKALGCDDPNQMCVYPNCNCEICICTKDSECKCGSHWPESPVNGPRNERIIEFSL